MTALLQRRRLQIVVVLLIIDSAAHAGLVARLGSHEFATYLAGVRCECGTVDDALSCQRVLMPARARRTDALPAYPIETTDSGWDARLGNLRFGRYRCNSDLHSKRSARC